MYINGLGLPTEVVKTRHYKAGYEVRTEIVDDSRYGGDGKLEMKSAYNMNGDYIGNSVDAYRICYKLGIKPELASPNHATCSIGFCERNQRWYGWSHRAIHGFSIGNVCKMGDVGWKASNKTEFIEELRYFYRNDESVHIKEITEKDKFGVLLESEVLSLDKNKIYFSEYIPFPEEWGKGTWTAKTLEDAKQMAIDFAKDVS